MRLFLSALALALAGCSMMQPSMPVVEAQRDWRLVATEADRERLRDWRDAFVQGLSAARANGHSAEIAREGKLLDPDAAIGGMIPAGSYRCRVIKLGAKSPGMLDYVVYPDFRCRVDPQGAVQSFAKVTGSQRQVGLVFPNDPLRQVFLGTLMLGDEARAMQYGVDRERDVAGFVERIGPARWRLVMPRPAFESTVDVMELVPET